MRSKIEPLGQELEDYIKSLERGSFGSSLAPSNFKEKGIYFIGLLPASDSNARILLEIRKKLYALFWGDWKLSVSDLGNYKSVGLEEDRSFLKELLQHISETDSSIIFLGDGGMLNHHIADILCEGKESYNLSLIGSQLMLDNPITTKYASLRDQLKEDPKLFLSSSIGLQAYYNSVEDMTYANNHFYNVVRLGDVLESVNVTEPLLREADLISLDIANAVTPVTPVGLSAANLCSMLRYVGMGCVENTIMYQGLKEDPALYDIIALSIWYYIEGYTLRCLEDQFLTERNFEKYVVASDDHKVSFFRSLNTDRWWVSLSKSDCYLGKTDEKILTSAQKQLLIPCSQNVYKAFCHEDGGKKALELYRLIKKT